MQTYSEEMLNLFQKLGLDNDVESIDKFIDENKIFSEGVHLADASFWNKHQSEFIRESIYYDRLWSEPVDQLDIILRN